MSSLLDRMKADNSNPLMDFWQEAYGVPQSIAQAGVEDNKDKLWLRFDGKKLHLMKGENSLLEWNGVSGKNGYQSSEYQNLKNKGPLPEGTYEVRQDQYHKMGFLSDFIGTKYPQIRRNMPDFIKAYMPAKVGSWSGGEKAWGTQKIALIPNRQNEMYGRKILISTEGKYQGRQVV